MDYRPRSLACHLLRAATRVKAYGRLWGPNCEAFVIGRRIYAGGTQTTRGNRT